MLFPRFTAEVSFRHQSLAASGVAAPGAPWERSIVKVSKVYTRRPRTHLVCRPAGLEQKPPVFGIVNILLIVCTRKGLEGVPGFPEGIKVKLDRALMA